MCLWNIPYDVQLAAKKSCLLQSLGAVTTAFLNQVLLALCCSFIRLLLIIAAGTC
jgi:hypothetical protein